MSVLNAGAAGLNMSAFGTTNPIGAPTITSTSVTATLPGGQVELYSGNFAVTGSASGDLMLTGGTATSYELDPAGTTAPGGPPPIDPYGYAVAANFFYSITGANVSAAQLNQILSSNSLPTLLHTFLPGGDTYIGSAASDYLIGQGGNDTFVGGSGTETFAPAAGANTITGGTGIDTVVFQGPSTQYSIADNLDGSITVTDSVASRNGTDHISQVGNLQFTDKTVFVANGDQANVARLYSAALDRAPDAAGLAGWEAIYANNVSAATKAQGVYVSLAETSGGYSGTLSVAAGFTNSPEFQQKYGVLSDSGFVNLLYENVLGRAADTPGLNSWLNLMENGDTNGLHYSREMVLVGFAESPENIAKTSGDWLFVT